MAKPVLKKHQNQRMVLRTAIGLLIIAGMVLTYQWLMSIRQDPADLLPGNSTGMIAAVEYTESGSKIIVLQDGKVTEVPGHTGTSRDESPVWRPDGQRLFFSSDREENTFNIFRWRPGGDKSERRSVGSRSKSAPWFGPEGYVGVNESGLITSGGVVMEYSPKDGSTKQILPPPQGSGTQDEEGGVGDQFSVAYSKFGTGFEKARYGQNRDFIIASMRRDTGRVLIYQNLLPDSRGMLPAPIALFAGNNLDFDVNAEGKVAVSILGAQVPDETNIPAEFIKNGEVVLPFRNAMVVLDPRKPAETTYLFASKDDNLAMSKPVFSQDGSRFLIGLGSVKNEGNFEPQALGIFGTGAAEASPPTIIFEKPVFDYAWFPNNRDIVFARKEGDYRLLYQSSADGSDVKLISPSKGEFGAPAVSPTYFPAKN
ncbi:MAG: PD40 domain-containing protein [Armatimonadetes bacterium]|nr:PD40 domain-containing protein [Armatimonadota bacterium]